MKRMWKFASVAAAASMVLAACGGSDSSTDTTAAPDTTAAAAETSDIKVAVVYLGVPDDKGWTYQHEQGIAAAEAETGVTIKRVENVLDNADSEKTFEQLASEGYNLIFATSFGYGAPMAKVAAKYPEVCNQWATGAKFLLTKDGGGEYATFDDVPISVQPKKRVTSLVSPLARPRRTAKLVTLLRSRSQKSSAESTHSHSVCVQ